MKPGIKVEVGRGHGQQGMPGATVRSSKRSWIKTLNEGDDWFYILTDPNDFLRVDSVSPTLPVTITNHLSVPVTLEVKLRDNTVLDDVLKHGRRYHLAYGSELRATV